MASKLTIPDMSEDWFRRYGLTDPVQAKIEWDAWNAHKGRDEDGCLRCALRLASGLSEKAVRAFHNGEYGHLGADKRELLYAAARSFGANIAAPPDRSLPNTCRRVVLLTALAEVPSLSYHVTVLRGIAQAATQRGITVSVHDISMGSALSACCEEALHHSHADAAIMLRVTPDKETLAVFERLRVPLILVHADKLNYEKPVLANIVPDQRFLQEEIRAWADHVWATAPPLLRAAPIVISLACEGTPGSIRDERIRMVKDGLKKYNPQCIEVKDYSFLHASKIYHDHPNALGFICLSDDLAVGMAHLIQAARKRPHLERVLGFDNSPLARNAGIASFDQHVDELGGKAISTLVDWFREQAKKRRANKKKKRDPAESQHDNELIIDWGPFYQIPVTVNLSYPPTPVSAPRTAEVAADAGGAETDK